MFIPNLLLTLSLLFPAAQLRRELLGPSAAVLHPTVNLRARLSAAPPAWLPVSVRCRLPRTAAAPVVAPAEGNEAAVAPTRPARAAARAVPAPTSTSTLVGRREDPLTPRRARARSGRHSRSIRQRARRASRLTGISAPAAEREVAVSPTVSQTALIAPLRVGMMGAEPSAGPLARPVRSLSSAAAPGLPPTEPPPPSPRPRAASKLRGAAKAQRGSAGKSKKNPAQKAFSCHYCRQKRSDIVTCPKHTEGHRWCGSCVRNHLGLDIEKIRRNKDKIWPDGCAASPLSNRCACNS